MSIRRTMEIAVLLTGSVCVSSLWADEKTSPQAQVMPVPASANAVSAETVKDADGNIYHTVKIGNQVWTVENLRTTRFNDGTPIPNVNEDAGWKSLATPGFCYYENNPEHGKKYGALYNWYAASSDKIAPKGWRVPTHDEQMALRDYLIANGYNYDGTKTDNKVAKSMAAKTDWIYKPTDEGGGPVSDIGTVGKNPETNNRTGFSALPAGSRWNDGSFHALGTSVYWWSTTPDGESIKAHMSSVHTWFAKYGNNQHHKRSGFCIRLIRDEDNKGGNATTLQPASETQGKSFGNPDKIDVLIVTSGHHFNRDSFFGIFKCDDIAYSEYTLKDESEVFEDISAWNYDVILLYNMTQRISPKRQDNFVRLLKEKGIGLVVMHHAQAAFQSWREYHYIIGTAYIYFDVEIDGKPWPHGKVHEGLRIPISVMDDRHPITRGMKDFEIVDETYKGRWWAKDNHVLLTTSHPENDEPIAWTREYGKAKVFNIQLGHDEQAHNCPEFRELLVRGIRWTAGTQGPIAGDSVGESTETVQDADGNIYHTVRLGNQVWTVENLRTTRYNDGTLIPNVTDDAGWKGLASPGFCHFQNDPDNGKKYGALYNWWAACSDKIATKGWRVPTHEDQVELCEYLIANGYNCDGTKDGNTTGNKVAKSMTAKTDWEHHPTPETAGNDLSTNNSSGFSALPTGSRWNDGSFHSIGQSVYWWSTTPGNGDDAHMSSIHARFTKYGFNQHHKRSGFCIRLVRDASEQIPSDGLRLWFRADRGVTHSDNKVSQWDDQSGSNMHAKTAGGQPMLLASAIGGKPAIHLNGKGDMLQFEGWSPNGLTAMTMTIVCANTEFQPEPYKGGWDEGGHCGTLQSVLNWPEQPNTGPHAWGNVIVSAFQKSVSYRFGTGQLSNSNNWKRPASLGDAATLTTAIKDGATEKVFVEGELVWTQTDKLTTIKNTDSKGFIGRWSHGGDNSGWYLGNVAEIIVYTRALDDTDRKKVEDYLKAKYFADK